MLSGLTLWKVLIYKFNVEDKILNFNKNKNPTSSSVVLGHGYTQFSFDPTKPNKYGYKRPTRKTKCVVKHAEFILFIRFLNQFMRKSYFLG